jgi:pilus assembly protein Flp/PilA
MNKLLSSIRSFAVEDDGAQIVEYALIIAMVSIALAGLLSLAFTGGGNMFDDFVARVQDCLGGNTAGLCSPGPAAE